MIDFGLSDDYLSGYTAKLKGEPFCDHCVTVIDPQKEE